MHSEQSPEAIDTRLVFRIYAGMSIAAGLVAYAWPKMLLPLASFPAATPESPWALARVAAALVAASGVAAAGLSTLPNPVSRARALYAFAIAHVVFGVLFLFQWIAILERILPASVGLTPIVAGLVLFYIAATNQSDTGDPSLETLRSQYEEQIQEAARQEERTRLARDLHDAVKQQLFVIQTSSAAVDARLPEDLAGAKSALAQVRTAAREATTEMETLIDQLQTAPLETSGLREALKRQCEALAFRTGADVELSVGDLPPDMSLRPGTQRHLFRGAQEALANIGRHARATEVAVTLGINGDQLELTIKDNGAGFDSAAARTGMGLENMRERARALGGTFLLTTAAGEGTTAQFIVPLRHQTMRQYAFKALFWAGLLLANIITWKPDHVLRAAVSAVAVVATVRYLVALVRLHRAGARWR